MTEEFRELCEKMVRIADALDNRAPQLANQGQALDGFSALANFRHLASQARTALAAERPESAEPVATLHISDFRGYENYEFQHLVDLPPGHYKLFTACTAQPPAPGPTIDDIWQLCEDHEFHLGMDGANEEESAEGLLQIINAALARWGNPAPAPAADGERDHVPGAGNMVPAAYAARLRQCPTHGQLPANAWGCPECLRELRQELARLRPPAADGEAEELAQWLERIGDDYDDLYRLPSALIRPKLARAAALLREARPQPVPGWQPIDTAPQDGTEILASDYDAIEVASWDAWETGSGWIDRNGQHLFPAWWQPLPDHPPIPQPPQGGEVES